MSGQFRTTGEEMRAFAGRIGEVNSQIQGELSRLNSLVESITSGWQGDAANAYHRLQEQWNEDARKLNQVLAEIQSAIEQTSSQYQATEQEQHSSVSNIQAALG
jgi:WXG100 family type VII secretion target